MAKWPKNFRTSILILLEWEGIFLMSLKKHFIILKRLINLNFTLLTRTVVEIYGYIQSLWLIFEYILYQMSNSAHANPGYFDIIAFRLQQPFHDTPNVFYWVEIRWVRCQDLNSNSILSLVTWSIILLT